VAAGASAGCSPPTPVSPGETRETLDSGGETYTVFRHVPPAYDGTTPLPSVIDFHGYAEGAAIHSRMSMLGALGDTQGFVTITPQGQGAIPMWDTALDGGDMKFVGALLDRVESTLCIDTNRVFAAGLSNGAFMTSAVACVYADRIAAVAPVAGISEFQGCDPARPVPVVTFHGTADRFVSYGGGLGESAMDLPAPDGSGRTFRDLNATERKRLPHSRAVPVIVAAWARRNDCARPPTRTKLGTDVTRVRYRCPRNATVELYRVEGGGHAWPGSQFSKTIASVVGATTSTVSASDVMWSFFRRHPLRGA
jgi:polyhydroxybutyrate depolymerase